jgi:hypothetical protein
VFSRTKRQRTDRLSLGCILSPRFRLANISEKATIEFFSQDIVLNSPFTVTYDHRLRRIGHPVRSAIHKPQIGRLVVGWVTTSEYLLLYVFAFAFAHLPPKSYFLPHFSNILLCRGERSSTKCALMIFVSFGFFLLIYFCFTFPLPPRNFSPASLP